MLVALAALTGTFLSGRTAPPDPLEKAFLNPSAKARPWVYWYFMDGHLSKEGMSADLRAMKAAGIGGAIFLEVGIGVPKGPVEFMSPKWQELVRHAFTEANRLGIEIAMGSGPGWCGTGGPWVKPEDSMQHLVSSEALATGPARFDAALPRPQPRAPFFGEGTLTPELHRQWREFYRDVVVLAFPTPSGQAKIEDVDEKALYFRAPYSSVPGVKPFLTPRGRGQGSAPGEAIPSAGIVDLTDKLSADGRLSWDVPPGKWTIMRFGRTLTGQTTRPAPEPGIGFETDKFNPAALDRHLQSFVVPLLKGIPRSKADGSGVTQLHFDSWEMSSQNWSAEFRREFTRRRGYDPLRMLPAMAGRVVDSAERSERFLWDLRQTAQELVVQNHVRRLKSFGKSQGLAFSSETYDMNPASDLELGKEADVPMGEFWSTGYGFDSEYSVIEATSIAHTMGRPIVGAEAFTSNPGEDWRQYPGSMKAQTDWALCAGINRFVIHRFQAQPEDGGAPGMGMGPYGVRWDRTQTWWEMVGPYHQYLGRCQEMLRRGRFVADVLYLSPEGAPNVFLPPASAFEGELRDRRGYNFDGCAPSILLSRASVRDGRIVMPDGMTYGLLVLPRFDSMTPKLLRKIAELVRAGATIVGRPSVASPSLAGYPASDDEVRRLARELWGGGPPTPLRAVGKGFVVFDADAEGDGERAGLEQARWIWRPGGNPLRSAPVGTWTFTREILGTPGRRIRSAHVAITADNTFRLSVNGRPVGTGNDFHRVGTFDVSSLIRGERDVVTVEVDNEGDAPNPAGLIAAVTIRYEDGTTRVIPTDGSWRVSAVDGTDRSVAQELGPMGTAPWGLTLPPVIYPSYGFTSRLLAERGIAPDFETDGDARSVHRRDGDTDIYFVANRRNEVQCLTARFRVSGRQPEWWNPVTGEIRPLPQFSQSRGVTSVPLRFEPLESGFVIFRKPSEAEGTGRPNFPEVRPVQQIDGGWLVSFDPRWGGPAGVAFPTLSDWSKNADPGIKYYSGKAVYRTSFDTPTPRDVRFLSLGRVKNLASVRLNGRDLGIVWCDPWRVAIPPGTLREAGNQLEVTVANLWINRLIGDSGLPPGERRTRTTYQPFRPDSPLQESGLLGPVTLDRVIPGP